MKWTTRRTYLALGDGASEKPLPSPSSQPMGFWLFAMSVAIVLGFSLGRFLPKPEKALAAPNNIVPSFQTSPQVFIYNRTFTGNNDEAKMAWTDLFPNGDGYFAHPSLAPKTSTLSVYHYLHCLDGIRKSYWKVHDMAVAGEKLVDADLPMMVSPAHIRHCIDLLRRALVCNPDLTVEVQNETGGVHGFGETHQCVDWSAVKTWTM
ncbi:hypothetical protein MY3296_006222 [Beauveria thailandica]